MYNSKFILQGNSMRHMPNSEKVLVNIQLNICYAFIAIGIVDMLGMSAENSLFSFPLVAFWRLKTLNFK